MKLLVYSIVDEGERVLYQKMADELGIDITMVPDIPTMETLKLADDADYIGIITTPITRPIMEGFRDRGIKMISTRSIGVDHIDMDAARDCGIKVSHAVYAPNAVSDYAIMLMLMVNRKMKRISQRAELQDFTTPPLIRGVNMNEQTVGVIGTGRIGVEVIRSLAGFGCRILAYSLHENEKVKGLAEYVPLETLYRESDIITLHTALTDDNFHFLNAEAFSLMKDGVRIINTARGGLIDSEALIAAIRSGKVGGAGLDCIEDEFDLYYYDLSDKPLENKYLPVLRSFPNVIVTPHMAYFTNRTIYDSIESVIRSGYLDAQGLPNPYLVQG